MTPSSEDPSAWLEAHARTTPDRTFLRTAEGARFSYALTAERVLRMASALGAIGVRSGERVAVQVEKSPEALLLGLACLRMGAVLVPLNTAYTVAELDYFIGDSEPHLVVVRPQSRDAVEPLAAKHNVTCVETLGTLGDGSLPGALAAAATDRFEEFEGDGESLAALLYTSGTTGRSKGAMITRRNLASNAVALAQAWRITSSDTLLHALPTFHVHGLFISVNSILAAGAGMLFLPRFEAPDVLRRLKETTILMGVPTFYTRLLQCPGLNREATSNMRLFVSGSAPLLAETHREFEARTGHAIVERYGMTETQIIASNPYEGARVPGKVGFPLPGVEVRIVGESDAPGVIEVRGPSLFKGYWRNPQKTAEDIHADGFFATGDVGRLDEKGYLQIVGRAKDLIISGGYNVYPIEVEQEIDSLAGVIESAVIGVPHADFGEGVTAVVLLDEGCRLTEAAILASLQERLAKYKLPKRVVFARELPRNALGKVQKNLLRAEYGALYRGS